MIDDALLDRFAAIAGPKGMTRDQELIAPWTTDWRGRYHGAARAMLTPGSTQEVAAMVQLAAETGVALVPQGGNTSMVGGATPPADGSALILSLRRMNQIRSMSAANNIAVCEAGVILSTLHDAAEAVGRRFPLSLGAKGSATIGGLVSTNAGGTQVLRHGTMRALVEGIEAVLPDGSIHAGLSSLKKDNRGFDLKHLLIGGEGTIGIVTAAALRLVPQVADRAVAWVGLSSPQDALALLRHLEGAIGPIVEGFELIPADTLASVMRHVPCSRMPIASMPPWHALIEIDLASRGEETAQAMMERALATAISYGLVADATVAANEAQGDAFWRIRDSLSEAERALGPALQFDISVPVAAMPDFILHAAEAATLRFIGTTASSFGHLGDGNVHFHVRAPAGTTDGAAWRAAEGEQISAFVHDLVVAAGGSISAEHGIGQMKVAELARLASPTQLATLRAIKTAFDPQGIMNPGKLIPA